MQQLDHPRRWLAVALAALAGFVDATGFLAAGGYFTSFMSGNTTRLGVDLSTDLLAAATPAGLIAGFVTGVVIGALLAERGGRRRKTAVLVFVLLALLAAALFTPEREAGFLAASVLAMGAINNVFRRDGEVAIGVTYMTGALVRFGQAIAARLLGQRYEGRLSAILLWLGLAFGAVGGASAYNLAPAVAPWIAAGLCLVMLGAAWLIERRAA